MQYRSPIVGASPGKDRTSIARTGDWKSENVVDIGSFYVKVKLGAIRFCSLGEVRDRKYVVSSRFEWTFLKRLSNAGDLTPVAKAKWDPAYRNPEAESPLGFFRSPTDESPFYYHSDPNDQNLLPNEWGEGIRCWENAAQFLCFGLSLHN